MLSELTYSLNTAPLASTALERKQALAKQFAEILHFTLLFDELKVCWGRAETPPPVFIPT